jgi:hypothetical protein
LGSDLDTQPKGGRYDGILGVNAALEVLRTIHQVGYKTYGPLRVVDLTNEEGARFSPAMIASGVWGGALSWIMLINEETQMEKVLNLSWKGLDFWVGLDVRLCRIH